MPVIDGLGFNIQVADRTCTEYVHNDNYFIEATEGATYKIQCINYRDQVTMVQFYLDGVFVPFYSFISPKSVSFIPGFYLSPGYYKQFVFAVPPQNSSVQHNSNGEELKIGTIEMHFFKAIPLETPYSCPCPTTNWEQQSIIPDKKFYLQSLSTKIGNTLEVGEGRHEKDETIQFDVVASLQQPLKTVKLFYQNRQSLEIIGILKDQQTSMNTENVVTKKINTSLENPIVID